MILKTRFFPTPVATDAQLVSVDLDGSTENLLNSTNQLIGISEPFSIAIWWKPTTATADMALVDISRAVTANSIRIRYVADVGTRPIEVSLRNGAGTLVQSKDWDIGDVTGLWTLTIVTWDFAGFPLSLFHNGVDQGAPDSTAANTLDNMADSTRNIGIGALFNAGLKFNGRIHSVGVWNSALTAAEVTALYNSGNGAVVNWASNSGNYVSSANLVHWWRLGHNSLDIGKDYGVGTAIDVDTDATNITAADIVSDYPGI